MAYNYVPYQYNPNRGFEDYAGEQFKGLFDVANLQSNPLQGFAQTPTYSPYSGTRSDFTTTRPSWYDSNQDRTYPARDTFDQKGYLDAQFGNINNYLGGLSSFLGNMSGGPSMVARQGEIQRAINRANMPTIGMSQPMGTPQMTSNPASPGLSGFGGGGGRLIGKGWGSHPAFKGLLSGGSGE